PRDCPGWLRTSGLRAVGDRLRFGPTATLEGTVDVAIGADGVPVVVWSDSSGLLLLTCGDRHCRGRWEGEPSKPERNPRSLRRKLGARLRPSRKPPLGPIDGYRPDL